MADLSPLELGELAAVAIMVAVVAIVVIRKRSFVFLACVGMFAVTALEVIPGVLPPRVGAFPDLAWRYPYLFEPLQWYRLFTHLFVHDGRSGAHIIGNVFTFVLLGWPLEEKIGWKLTMAIFFLTGVVGAILSSLFVIASGDVFWLNAYAFGASGSIFGVIGYFAARYPQEKVYAPIGFIFARVPIAIAAVVALIVQAIILTQITGYFGALPWPSVLAHVTSFGVGMLATKVPGLRSADNPKERAFHLDLSPLRELVVKPAEKMEVESIIAEDIPEVAQAKLESLVRRARCPKCQGAVVLKGRKLTSDCGWSAEFGRRAGSETTR